MIPIAETFRYDGFDFRLVKRAGRMCLFEKGKPEMHRKTYEVVRLRLYPDKVIQGRVIPAHEAMPCSEAWGRDGFSYSDLADAEAKFGRLSFSASSSGRRRKHRAATECQPVNSIAP